MQKWKVSNINAISVMDRLLKSLTDNFIAPAAKLCHRFHSFLSTDAANVDIAYAIFYSFAYDVICSLI